MTPHFAVFDDFFSDGYLRLFSAHMQTGEFIDVISPIDGIAYPGILQCAPDIQLYLRAKLGQMFELSALNQIIPGECFFRLTSEQQGEAPNKIHCDVSMGSHALLVYMNEVWPEGAGTSFWTHETEGSYQKPDCNHELVQSHTNSFYCWERNHFVQGRQNRALIYDARLWHCAEPVGGFGKGKEDGRCVLTFFFTLQK